MTKHPFQVGGALSATTSIYIEREADAEIKACIAQMTYVALIHPRQQGKTSLINRLIATMDIKHNGSERHYAFAVVDLSSWKGSAEETGYQSLGQFILDQLSFIPATKHPQLPVNGATWLSFLGNIAKLAQQAKLKIIIALDEVNAMPRSWASPFFSTIRSVFNYRQSLPHFNHLTFVLAGAFDPRTLIEDESISPFNIAQAIHLADFSIEEIKNLTTFLSKNPTLQTNLATWIYYWTDGQPYLTQWLCRALIGQDLTQDSIETAVKQLRREDRNHLPHVFAILTKKPSLQKYVERIATGYQPPFTPADSSRHMQLSLAGIIKADEQGLCKIRNRIYQQVLQTDLLPTETNKSATKKISPLTPTKRKSLKHRITELEKPLQSYNDRISALQAQIANTTDAEQTTTLKNRLKDLQQDYEKTLNEIEDIEHQLRGNP